MKGAKKSYELVFDYPTAFIFDENCLEIDTDNAIHICLFEADGYGSRKACEYVTGDEIITKPEEIDNYFKGLEGVTEIYSNSVVSTFDFLKMVKDDFKQLQQELEAGYDETQDI